METESSNSEITFRHFAIDFCTELSRFLLIGIIDFSFFKGVQEDLNCLLEVSLDKTETVHEFLYMIKLYTFSSLKRAFYC